MGFDLEKKILAAAGAIPLRSVALNVLVVDDNDCLLQVVHDMLEVLGFRVDSANGGHAAIRCLSQSRYDVMITDLQMPDVDGFALSCWLKHSSKDTKVIVMIESFPSDWVEYIHTGIVDRWISKPFSLTKLAGILDGLVPIDSHKRFSRHPGQHGYAGYDGQPSVPQPASMKETR